MENEEKVVETVAAAAPAPVAEVREARPQRTERPERPQRGGHKRRKVCAFCVDRADSIDYKDIAKLRRFLSERAKILPRRVTGTCAGHQRELTVAIKRARHVALLPFSSDN